MYFPRTPREHPAFMYAIVYVIDASIETAWLVPSADFNRMAYRGKGPKGRGIELQFMARPSRTDKVVALPGGTPRDRASLPYDHRHAACGQSATSCRRIFSCAAHSPVKTLGKPYFCSYARRDGSRRLAPAHRQPGTRVLSPGLRVCGERAVGPGGLQHAPRLAAHQVPHDLDYRRGSPGGR